MSRFDHILHRADGVTTVELNTQVDTFRAVTSEKLTAVRQDVWSAELTLVTSEAFIVNVGDWIEAKGMRLYCMSTIDRYTCSEDNNREYQLTFYDPTYYLRQAIFYNTSESVSEGVYSYSRVDNAYPSVGTFEDFVKLCCYNCNSVQGVRMFKVGTVSESILTDIRVLTFSDYNCLAVLKQTCEEFETTWRVRINEDPDPDSLFIIDFGVEIEDFPVTLQVEKSQGLMSIEVTASDKDVFTQFVVKGGTDNLPSDYPYTNLQLDEDLEGTPPVYANSIIKLPDLYARWGKSVKELIFEDINPRRTGTVTGINEDILKFTDSDLIGAGWSPAGGTIHFVSGHLIGFTFNCKAFDPETGEITIESAEENNGFILPSETDSYYRIGIGDKYNIAGVSLPASYVSAAKTELKERALLVINGYWSQQRIESIIKIDPSIISVDIVPNMGFHIIHNALGIDKIIMAKQVVYDLSLNYPYDIESITVSDWATDDSRADTLHRRVALAQILAKKKQQKGDPGEDGVTTYTWIKYADVADGTGLYDTPTSNTLYIGIAVNKTTPTESTTKTDYTWSKFKGDQGVAGEDGTTTYTWIKYGTSSAGAGITDDPTGMTYIGFAYNKTTPSESNNPADYSWSLIKGEQGNQGVQGPPGANGVTTYTWIKYSDNADGTGLYDTPTANTLYIGIAVNKTTATESTVKTDYVWSKFRGEQGVAGEDGVTTYTWIKYSSDSSGTGITDDPTGMTYIGLAYNKTTPTESTTPGDYTWSLIKGADGIDGIDGVDGVSITGVDVEFAKNTNPTTAPTTGWTTTAPTLLDGEQLWTRTKTAYSSGNPTYSTPANITPKKGDTGAVGQGVDSVTEEYAISTSKTTQPTTGWSTTQPTWVQGQYIWSRVKVVYKNPAQTIYTGYAVSSEWEAVNDLEIGSRNYILHSLMMGGNNPTFGDDDRGRWYNISHGLRDTTLRDVFKENTQYTLWYERGEIDTGNIRFRIYYTDSTHSGDIFTNVPFITPKNKTVSYVGITYGTGGRLEIINPTFVEGNKPMKSWTPAPEDVQADIAAATRDSVNAMKEQADATYVKLYANFYLKGDAKANLATAKNALNTAISELLSALGGTGAEAKTLAYDRALSVYFTRVQEAQEAIQSAIKTAAENAAKAYAEAQDIYLKIETDAYTDDKVTAAEAAAIAAAEEKVNAAKVAMEAYADGEVTKEEERAIADANEKYEAALSYAESLAGGAATDATDKVNAAKDALAQKFGYANWAAMAVSVSLTGGLTTEDGLISANVIDVETLAAMDAFINSLTVIKLETAADEDETKVRIDADAVEGRAGILLEETTGNRGIKLYYKATNGAPIFYLYSTDTSEYLEFLANKMKFAKGTTRDATIDSANSSLQLRNGTKYAHISPSELRVDDLPDAPVGTGKFWVDTTTGIVHWGIVTPPSVSYSFAVDVSYPSGRSDIAASGGVATFTVKLITTTDGTPDAGVLVDLDTGYPSVASSPTGTNFSITRTGTGTYSITAASRGTVENINTAAVISIKYTPSGATQQSTSFNVLQQANSKAKTGQDTGITLEISTIYECPASGDTWQVTASGESGGREEYTYTSGATQWISSGGTPITASDIAITTNGTGLSGSGTGAGAYVTWASRGTVAGGLRSGTITASYSGVSVSETVYQQYNALESVTDKVINWVKLDGTNGNIEVDADAGYTLVTVELGYTNHYTSGDAYSGTLDSGHTLSISGTGFSKYSNGRVDYTENTAQSTRNGVVTITYGDATPVQRTITQAAASATTYQILGEVTYPSGSQIPASGGTATLTVTKQTYINGVHQSASDVLVDCDSGYPDLTSQPTGCDVSITRTGVGTYSLSAESRGVVVNAGTDIEIDLQATIGGSAKTDSVTLVQQANALASSTNYQITSLKLDGTDDDIEITKAAQNITVTGSGTFTKTYTSGSTEGGTFNLGTGDISVSGTGFSYSNFTISAGANSGAERTCTVTASYTGASNVTRTITQAMGIVAPTLGLDVYSLSGSTITLKASISNAGGGTISACGFERGNTSALGTNESASTVQSGQFTADVSVIPGQTIYWRAYATNEAGTTYTTITNRTIPE